MPTETTLNAHAPASLAPARSLAHKAAQLLTGAARANLEAAPDDSHSNLGWDRDNQRFLSQPIPADIGAVSVALSLTPLELSIALEGKGKETLDLNGRSNAEAAKWLDDHLAGHGLKPASGASIPYDLPEEAAAMTAFDTGSLDGPLSSLAAWFDLAAAVLEGFVQSIGDLNPGPVRCWPHHFDIATYVQLQEGDFETAKGIGVGMSPGDETYDQPYFYINPWPHLDVAALPELPGPGHWHTQGFVGAIATADEVLGLDAVPSGLRAFIDASFAIGRGELGV